MKNTEEVTEEMSRLVISLCDKYKKTAEESFDEAEEQVTRGEKGIVVVLEILDHVGHEVGSEGTKYVDAAKMVIERTKTLFNHL